MRTHLQKYLAGFTLIEMVLAIAILAIIVGGVGASVSTCLQATEIVRQERIHQAQCDALQALLSHSLLVLPTDAVLRSSVADVRTDEAPPLRLLARQPVLIFTATPSPPGQASESAIYFRRQANGLLSMNGANLVNEREGFLPADALTSPTLQGVPLIKDIREAKWRFYDSQQRKWLDRWEKDNIRPSLVELNLQFAESPVPFTGTFWLPAIYVNNDLPGQSSSTPPPASNGGTNAPTTPPATSGSSPAPAP